MFSFNAIVAESLQGALGSNKLRTLESCILAFLSVAFAVIARSFARYGAYSLRILRFYYRPARPCLAATDETMQEKSDQSTHGIGRLYSSMLQNKVKGVCFFVLCLIDPKTFYVLGVEQDAGASERPTLRPKMNEAKEINAPKREKNKKRDVKREPKSWQTKLFPRKTPFLEPLIRFLASR